MDVTIDNTINHTNSQLQDDDVISLRDMQLYDQTATSSTRSSPRASSGHELFEFYPNPPYSTATADVIFCGKVISNSDRMLVGSSSLRLPERSIEHVIPMWSVSIRDLGSPRHGGVRFPTSGKKVNVTASKSKRRMFMIGPVPEMEMRSMKERQLRRAPSLMFPVADGGADVTNTVKNQRVKSRARLNSVLACLRIWTSSGS